MFRKMKPDDRIQVLDISKDIWEGSDYIENIFDDWVNEDKGEFTCLEIEDKVVGFCKMTNIDSETVWFEGIRVGSSYRNRGFGSLLSDYQIKKAKELGYKKAQLATYRLNDSIGIIDMLKFRKIGEYKYQEIVLKNYNVSDIDYYDQIDWFDFNQEYLGVDFTFLKGDNDLLDKLVSRNEVYQYKQNKIILSSLKSKGNSLSIVDFYGDFEEVFKFIVYMGKKTGVDVISSMSKDDGWIDFLNEKSVFKLDEEYRDSYLYELDLEEKYD